MTENEISKLVVDICYRIHKEYGPGLFESVYESIFCFECDKNDLIYQRHRGVKVFHEGIDMGIGFVPDVVMEEKVIVEFKSVIAINEVHFKQVLTYLKLTNLKLGLLINFNESLFKNGVYRIANGL